MGMSASQARLLYITSKLNHLSLQGQNVSDAKIRLSMDSEAIQEKYSNALNKTNLYAVNNIFATDGSMTTDREAISLANLKALGYYVTNGNRILGFKAVQVDTGETQKVKIGEEDDLTKPIYPTISKPKTDYPMGQKSGDDFKAASTSAYKVGGETLSVMGDVVNAAKQMGLSDNDIGLVSYKTDINGELKTINSIAIKSQAGFEAILNLMGQYEEPLSQNYVLDLPEGTTLDLSAYSWKGLSGFKGVFDGNFNTIENLNGKQGFFEDLYGTVKNLNLNNVNIENERDILGGLAGYLADGAVIENCNVTNLKLVSTLDPDKEYPIGYKPERLQVGGLVGNNNGNIKNSSVEGTINIPNADESYGQIGGFIGANINREKGDSKIENCYADVDIILGSGSSYTNSINSFIGDDSHEATISNCSSVGKITTSGGSAINGKDLAGYGAGLESDVHNMVVTDTRNNNSTLYYGDADNLAWGKASTSKPSSFDNEKSQLADGTSVNVWLNPGDEGYDEQAQQGAKDKGAPVLNLTGLQKGEGKTTTTEEPDTTQKPIAYEKKDIFGDVPIYRTEMVIDDSMEEISTAELERGLREGLYTLAKIVDKETTQSTKINGMDCELVSWQSCTDITDKQDQAILASAEAEYNKGMQEIQSKDKRLEIDQKKIDTEYKALQTEEESIKTVLQKNVERSFKTFG